MKTKGGDKGPLQNSRLFKLLSIRSRATAAFSDFCRLVFRKSCDQS